MRIVDIISIVLVILTLCFSLGAFIVDEKHNKDNENSKKTMHDEDQKLWQEIKETLERKENHTNNYEKKINHYMDKTKKVLQKIVVENLRIKKVLIILRTKSIRK